MNTTSSATHPTHPLTTYTLNGNLKALMALLPTSEKELLLFLAGIAAGAVFTLQVLQLIVNITKRRNGT